MDFSSKKKQLKTVQVCYSMESRTTEQLAKLSVTNRVKILKSNLKPPALRKFSQKDLAQFLAISSSAVGISLELST